MQTSRVCPSLFSVTGGKHCDKKQLKGEKGLFTSAYRLQFVIQKTQSRSSRQEHEAKPQNTATGLPSGLVMLSYLCYTIKSMGLRMVLPTVGWDLLYQIAINEMSPQTHPQAGPDGGNSSVTVSFFPGVSHCQGD